MKSQQLTRIGTFCLITSLVLSCFCFCKTSAAEEPSPVSIAERACAGFYSIKEKGEKGTVKFENYQITVDAGGELTIEENGILLKKVQNFSYQDYTSCLVNLTEILKGIKPGAMLHILNELKLNEFGQTSLKYLKTLLGNPRVDKEDDNLGKAVFQKGGYELEIIYRVNPDYSSKPPHKLLLPIGTISNAKITLEPGVNNDSREPIDFKTYWNEPICDNNHTNCVRLIKDGAVLGRTTLKDFRSGDCQWITREREDDTALDPSPTYQCGGSGSDGLISVVLYVRPVTGQAIKELNELEDYKAPWKRTTTNGRIKELDEPVDMKDIQGNFQGSGIEKAQRKILDNFIVVGIEIFD